MWKSFLSSFAAITIFVFAGMEVQKDGFSEFFGILALFSVGASLMGYAFRSHAKWCAEKNYSDRVLCKLDSDRVYAVFDRGTVGSESVSFLYDAVARKTVVYRGPTIPKGFHAVAKGDRTYLVPDGKKLGLGDKDEFICVQSI